MAYERLACVMVDGFSFEVRLRDVPQLSDKPVVVADRNGDNSPLAALNAKATAAGLSLAMTVAQARGRCPGLEVVLRDEKREREEAGKLVRRLRNIGPLIEEERPGVFFLQVSGLSRLHGDEPRLARKILAVLRPTRYPLKVGLADNKRVARIAAELTDTNGYTIVPAGTQRRFLAPLAVERLWLPVETTEKLHALGIMTVGQLAAFPPHEITRRFGSEVIALARYVRGGDDSFFRPEKLSAKAEKHLVLDYPVTTVAGLVAHLEPLLKSLLGSLAVSGLGCRAVDLGLTGEDGTREAVTLAVNRPTASVKRFLGQVPRVLEKGRLKAGVSEITVTVPRTVSLAPEQLRLVDNRAAAGGNPVLPAGGLKRYRLYRIEKRSQPLPEEDFALISFSRLPRKRAVPVERASSRRYRPYAMRPLFGLRLVSPPRRARVTARSGRLCTLQWGRRRYTVTDQDGPWKLSGGWWRDSCRFDRLYYEVETAGGAAFLLFFDRSSSGRTGSSAVGNTVSEPDVAAWFLQGVFD
jgi:nucleotidyltransferase/DNA polymerase involved in DNA repair